MPLLEQRKKRGFCKYHNFLGHKISQCFLFKDLVHNTIKDDQLKFADKGKTQMQIDANPLHLEANYSESLQINMLEAVEGPKGAVARDLTSEFDKLKATGSLNGNLDITKATEGLRVKLQEVEINDDLEYGVNMMEVDKDVDIKGGKKATPESEHIKVAYPKDDESLVEFLGRCKSKKSEAMLCLRCSAIFDRKAAQHMEVVQLAKRKGNWGDTAKPQVVSDHH